MPSSHAQFLFFFSTFLTLFLLFRRSQPSTPSLVSTTKLILFPPALYLVAFAVAGSRIYLNYHTPKQVLVGCLAGAVCAVVWFVAVMVMRQIGIVDWVLNTRMARELCMRDLVAEMELWEAGWGVWEEKRRRVLVTNGKKSR
jgi:dolichyldiphosphatase